jgi:hypothetical protein
MPLDPSIALSYRPIQLADPLAQYGQIAQLQSAQNQNALAQYQLGSAQRQEAAQNALSSAYQKAYNPDTGEVNNAMLVKDLAEGGAGHLIPDVQAKLLATQKERGLIKKTELETSGLDFKQKVDKANKAISDIASLSSPQEAIASIDAHLAKGDIDQQKADMLKTQVTQAPSFVGWQKGMLINILDAKDKLTMTAPKISRQEAGGAIINIQDNPLLAGYGLPVKDMANIVKTATPGELMTNARELSRIKLEGERLGHEGRRLALAEETSRREGDPAFAQRMQSAKTTGELIAKGDVAAKQALPGAIANAEEAVNLIDQLVGKPTVKDASGKVIEQGTKKHPGFANAVGATWLPGIRFVPGTDAANFQAAFDQVQGAAFLEAFNVLRGAGAITEKEGAKATAARTRMSLAQSETEFTTAAREYQDVIRKGVKIMQQKAGGAPAAAGAVDTSNPLLK